MSECNVSRCYDFSDCNLVIIHLLLSNHITLFHYPISFIENYYISDNQLDNKSFFIVLQSASYHRVKCFKSHCKMSQIARYNMNETARPSE